MTGKDSFAAYWNFRIANPFHRRSSTERVANPLLNDEFFNELEFEESPPYSLVLHGMPPDWMEQVEDQDARFLKVC